MRVFLYPARFPLFYITCYQRTSDTVSMQLMEKFETNNKCKINTFRSIPMLRARISDVGCTVETRLKLQISLTLVKKTRVDDESKRFLDYM